MFVEQLPVNIFSRSVSRLLDEYLIDLKEVLVNKQCLLNTFNFIIVF